MVVIAIIGILSSVVLASLNSARVKGAVASAKANMANTRAQAEIFYDANGNKYYNGSALTDVCSSTASVGTPAVRGIYDGVLAAARSNTATASVVFNAAGPATTAQGICNSAAGAWAAEVLLKDGNFYCVDANGSAKISTTTMLSPAGDTAC